MAFSANGMTYGLPSTAPGKQFRGGQYSPFQRDSLFAQGTGGFTGQGFGPTSGIQMPVAGQPMGPAGNRMQPMMNGVPPANPGYWGQGKGGLGSGLTTPWGSAGQGVPTMGVNGGGAGSPDTAGPGMYGFTPFNQPSPMFSPDVMQKSQNQVFGSHVRSADLPSILKQLDRPGVSQDEGTLASAANISAGRMANAGAARAQIGLDDYLANAQHMLRSQVGAHREMTGMGGIFQRMQDAIQNYDIGQLGDMAGLIGRLANVG